MTDTLVAGTRLAGRYEIEELIGRGRSPVYRARDTRLGRAVAVKEIGLVEAAADDRSRADRSRALREARAAARVRSPAVVQVYDVVDEPTAVWLVMELVRAPSLDRLVADRGPLDEVRAARIGLGLLDALEAAHAQGVVHRDVRPANVLVGDLDDPTVDVPVRLTDFGLAALRDDTALTAPGVLSDSPAFTAPEQVTGGRSGPATDLWALGAVLYFAVEGTAPFAGDSPAAVSAAVEAGDVRPAERADRLARIVEMLLAPDPARRPSARRVRAVLHAVATGTEPGDDTQEAPAPGAAAAPAAMAAGSTDHPGAEPGATPAAVAGDRTPPAGTPPAVAGGRTPPAGTPGPATPAGAPGVLDPTVPAGVEPTLPAGSGAPGVLDPTVPAGVEPTLPAGSGAPGVLDPTVPAGTEPTRPARPAAPATAPRRPRRRSPRFALAAIAAAVLLLAGLAALTWDRSGDPDPSTPSTSQVEPKDATPAPDRVDPPATGEDEPADTAPETTAEPSTTAPPTTMPSTTAPPTTAPPTTEPPTTAPPTTEPPTTAPPTTEAPPTTAGEDGGATSSLSDPSAGAGATSSLSDPSAGGGTDTSAPADE